MMCPACGYTLAATDRECPRCHGTGVIGAAPGQVQKPGMSNSTKIVLGITCGCFVILGLFVLVVIAMLTMAGSHIKNEIQKEQGLENGSRNTISRPAP